MKSDRVDWFTKPNVVMDGVLLHRTAYQRTSRGITAPSGDFENRPSMARLFEPAAHSLDKPNGKLIARLCRRRRGATGFVFTGDQYE